MLYNLDLSNSDGREVVARFPINGTEFDSWLKKS